MSRSAKLSKWTLATALLVSAVANVQALELKPDSLAAIDRNRKVVIERIIAQFQPTFAPGQEQMVRETLKSLRADHLLAASLAPNLDGLLAVMKSAETGVAGQPLVQTKQLGDATDDLVYTPVIPCRLFDTRPSQNGSGSLVPNVVRTYSATTPVAQQGGPGGCSAPAGTAVALMEINPLTPADLGLLQGGAHGTEPFPNALLLYQPNDQNGVTIAMPVLVANGQFDLIALYNGLDVAGDLLGYFKAPGGVIGTITQVSPGTGLTGGGSSGNATLSIAPGGVTATEIASNAVTTTAIADGSITLAKIGANGCTNGQIMKFNGSAWVCAANGTPAVVQGFLGSAGTSIPVSANFQFVGGTTTIALAAPNTRLVGSAMGALGLMSGASQNLVVDLCYQLNGVGTINNFSGLAFVIGIATTTRTIYPVASQVALSAGSYKVGMCVVNNGPSYQALDNNDFVNGWVMATP